jgi:hypothetical protein
VLRTIQGTFEKKIKFSKNVDFVRVSFQFLARVLATRKLFSDMTTSLGRSFQGLVEVRAVLAGVAETHRKNRLEGLNVPLAGGPFTCCPRCLGCFCPAREGAKHSPAFCLEDEHMSLIFPKNKSERLRFVSSMNVYCLVLLVRITSTLR